ncbi:phytanoyl-CoA dioxygenase family protein [Saccharothrix longispora]|uniref:phytanoyl-CoA dioxygenase family protein n=1 Tax=Saccharothrix longispora TaxID=33920 RepID=UPI0028FD54DB|nr:phytanoyl-CoA dioxygenase family protein [Saccharothrix longispora]MBY8851695.1 phytanoyl-CoA dioxygenase family protein [Saccharothrix sp. MB29]MDU0288759.1 phytanoyl-CoA dioxygenase family protein [Saccharothrix longispora]
MTGTDVDTAVRGLHTDGIAALRGAFEPEWADRLREDVEALFREAMARPDGAIGRGPNRYYVEIHPERIRGFLDLVTHPWVDAVARAVLGPDYQVVEIGFDVPLPGAVAQPWHRDFPAPRETVEDRRLTSLAFNVTTVDTVPEMGPFEIAHGTQWDDGADFDHGMFPPKSAYPRYEGLARRKLPRRGDVSVRSALTIHRGTANRSGSSRPVLVLGLVAAGVENDRNDLVVSRAYHERLPDEVRAHLGCRVVDELEPLVQKHTIEGLVMGATD